MSGKGGPLPKKNTTRKRGTKARQKYVTAFREKYKNLAEKQPSWYKIPEIDIRDYYYCVQKLFQTLEKSQKVDETVATMNVEDSSLEQKSSTLRNVNMDDSFMKAIFLGQTGATEDTWINFERQRRFANAIIVNMGDFHEELAGKFPGYITLPVGHATGLNIVKLNNSASASANNEPTEWDEVWEFKNRFPITNTIREQVYKKMEKLLSTGSVLQCFLVFVNAPPGWKKPSLVIKDQYGNVKVDLTPYKDQVNILSGEEAYTYLSKRPTFWRDLHQTIYNTFQNKSLLDTIKSTALAMNENS